MKNASMKDLAMRDPALAAALGVLPGTDFGAESDFGNDYGFGIDSTSAMGFGFGADAPSTPPATPQAMMALWKAHHAAMQQGAHRDAILNPNKNAAVKVGRYTFSASQALTLGTAAGITATNNPDTNIRPQRVTMNAPNPGFVTISEIKAANVSVTVGGILDAYQFNAVGQDQSLDMPTITPAMKVSVLGQYTGFVPAGFVLGQPYLFVASFTGPAAVVPND